MNQNPLYNIFLAGLGVLVFLLFFRVSLALIAVLVLAGVLAAVVYGVYYLYRQGLRYRESLKYDEQGRRIIQASILEKKDSEDSQGETSKPH